MASDFSGIANSKPSIETDLAAPVLRREVLAIVIWTVLADLLIFRTFGYTGPGLFFALVPLLFLVGYPGRTDRQPRPEASAEVGPAKKLTVALITLVAVRLIWSGTGLAVFSGVVLVVALSMSAAGYMPYVLEGFVLAARAIVDGAKRLAKYRLTPGPVGDHGFPDAGSVTADDGGSGEVAGLSGNLSGDGSAGKIAALTLPVVAAMVFGAIFVFANPDLFDWVSGRVSQLADRVRLWLVGMSIWELPFCVTAMLVGAGLMRPVLPMVRIGPQDSSVTGHEQTVRSPFYNAFRNTLLTLIVLFAVYLVFEFVTLWKREFPDGFYYAGYAHQGAAWLTYALALATALLSVIFSGLMLSDDRLGLVRRLAWLWSAQNILLAAAVYNRLAIYVGYNGMTRMRTVGFFGITVVVVGFALVLYKIGRQRSFWWLIRAQLIALVLTVIAYSLFPVDYVVHRYNAGRVQSGYLHPSVMIAVKPTMDEGVFPLLRLTECEDPVIRDGVLALLAERQIQLEETSPTHWTEFQGSTMLLEKRLKQNESKWIEFWDPVKRKIAIETFQEYAMKWY